MGIDCGKITDFTIDGKCSGCGECCSGVLPLSKQEVSRIKSYVRQKGIKEHRRVVMVGVDATCPFRDEKERKCTIYPVRPDICKHFMCSHDYQDIMQSKMDFHKHRDVVFMREEFFGNSELREFFIKLARE